VGALTDGYKAALNVDLIGSNNNQPYTMTYDTVKQATLLRKLVSTAGTKADVKPSRNWRMDAKLGFAYIHTYIHTYTKYIHNVSTYIHTQNTYITYVHTHNMASIVLLFSCSCLSLLKCIKIRIMAVGFKNYFGKLQLL
jgi:hypothetical protein